MALILWLGDIAVFLLFAAIGRSSHGLNTENNMVALINTVWPFIVAWVVVRLVSESRIKGAQKSLVDPIVPHKGRWQYKITVILFQVSLALLLASLLRAWALSRFSPLSFYGVSWVSLNLLMLLWRFALSFFYHRLATKY